MILFVSPNKRMLFLSDVIYGTVGYMRVWTGLAWELRPLRMWDGTTWEVKTLRIFNGSTWSST